MRLEVVKTGNPEGVGTMATMAAVVGTRHEAMLEGRAETGERVNVTKNILLFLAAPWIGLAYIIALPFVGCAVLARAAILRR